MAKVRTVVSVYMGGIEETIDNFAGFYMGIAFIGTIVFVVLFFADTSTIGGGLYSEARVLRNFTYLELAMASLFSSFFFYAALRGIAEAIRLLKKIAGLPYSGRTSKPTHPSTENLCPACDRALPLQAPRCPNCGETIEW
jgi:hypothetical protein